MIVTHQRKRKPDDEARVGNIAKKLKTHFQWKVITPSRGKGDNNYNCIAVPSSRKSQAFLPLTEEDADCVTPDFANHSSIDQQETEIKSSTKVGNKHKVSFETITTADSRLPNQSETRPHLKGVNVTPHDTIPQPDKVSNVDFLLDENLIKLFTPATGGDEDGETPCARIPPSVRKQMISKLCDHTALEWTKSNLHKFSQPEDAFLASKFFLSPQSYGLQLQNWIMKSLKIQSLSRKQKNHGDGCVHRGNSDQHNIEIKVSICCSTTQTKFHAIQLRPGHDLDSYLFAFYNLGEDEVYWFLVPSRTLYDVLWEEKKMSSYAHGTKEKNGTPSRETLGDKEYRITINMNDSVWVKLSKFKYTFEQLKHILEQQ